MRKPMTTTMVCGLMLASIGLVMLGCGVGMYRMRGPATRAEMAGRPAEPRERSGMTEELWVIARSPEQAGPAEEIPGQGELRAKPPGAEEEVPLPLKHTDVRAQVVAFIATVNVTQIYENPYDTKIEAVYVFPLPETAAVTDFIMTIGVRHIRGVIREREEATRIYEEAKGRGYVASLLTQERPNIFTQKVANIEPGNTINVEVTYFNPLRYDDGEYEFVFPMVVGPRFNPPGYTEGVGAVAMGKHGSSGQRTEVQYLPPGKRSGHDISLSVDIDAGVQIEDIYSHTHAVEVNRQGPSRVVARLSSEDALPNRDFVLRYKVAGKTLKTALLTHRGESGNTFALVVQPPQDTTELARMPREMIFVLDCSGSMFGWPLAKAKEAMRRCLRKLDANDTFQIVRFSDRASKMGAAPVPATAENVGRGLMYLENLQSEGGTMMIEGIKAALDFPHDQRRLRIVSLLTDGYIGNEDEIFAAIKQKLGAARIFSFGVGPAVNRYLLEGVARLGRGAVAYVGLEEGAARAVDGFYERVARPALTDVRIDWGSMRVDEVYPKQLPDIFVGRPLLVSGRFEGAGRTTVRVTGRVGNSERTYAIDVDLDEAGSEHAGITGVWARWRIADLSDMEIDSPSAELRQQITRTSLQYKLLCRYTAFLAVDASRQTAGDHGVTVDVPVPVPAGVRYETTVEE
jgi:Ca-activated chloride channel family protein